MPILPVNAEALIRAVDPQVRLDGLTDAQLVQESSNVMKVLIQTFNQPVQRQDSSAIKFRAGVLKDLGYRIDEISPSRLNITYEQAVKALLQGYQKGATKLTQPKRVMIALPIPEHIGLELLSHVPIANREQAKNLHITLAYLGKLDDFPQQEKVIKLLAELGGWSHPIAGTVSGIGRFNASPSSDWMDVIYATYDSPKLLALRDRILHILGLCGLEHKQNHGFTPHITLAYVPPASQQPLFTIPDVFIAFQELSLYVNGQQHRIAIAGNECPSSWVHRTPEVLGDGELQHRREDARTWVNDPTVRGGGYWREQNQAKKDPPPRRITSRKLPPLQVISNQRFRDFEMDIHKLELSQNLKSPHNIVFFAYNPKTGEEALYKEPNVINPERVAEVTSEVVASQIGRSSGVPINDVQLVPAAAQNSFKMRSEVGGTLHTIAPGLPVEAEANLVNSVASPYNIQLGMTALAPPLADKVVENSLNHPDLAKIAAYDMFVSNQDRTVANLFHDPVSNGFHGVDQGMAFVGSPGSNESYVPHVEKAFDRLLEKTDNLKTATPEQKKNFQVYRQTLNKLVDEHPYKQVIGQMMQTTKASLSDAKAMTGEKKEMLVDVRKRVSFFKAHHPQVVKFRDRLNQVEVG